MSATSHISELNARPLFPLTLSHSGEKAYQRLAFLQGKVICPRRQLAEFLVAGGAGGFQRGVDLRGCARGSGSSMDDRVPPVRIRPLARSIPSRA